MLDFQNVSKHFGSIKALDGVSFTIGDGEFVFLVGSSGAGKTTLLKLLLREYNVTSGNILFDGVDVDALKKKDIPSLRQNIGAVFQDYKLLSERTIAENVQVALAIKKVPRSEWNERVMEVLKIVGLSERANLFPSQLSGGESQRAVLARALVVNPKIIFADEPTGNLDQTTATAIINLLLKLNKEGKTVVVATHDLGIVKRLKKRVIELDHGKVVSHGEGSHVK